MRHSRAAAIFALAPAGLAAAARLYVRSRGRGKVIDLDRVAGERLSASTPPGHRFDVAAVLGAGLRPDQTPTPLLVRRVDAAVALYRMGATDRLLMSGNVDAGGDQPAAMHQLAVQLGVPDDAVDLDRSGADTAATCRYLAAAYPDRPVALVTQQFHAHRAAYLASKAGLDAVVIATPDSEVRPKALTKGRIREVAAAVKAVALD